MNPTNPKRTETQLVTPRLVCVAGKLEGKSFELNRPETTIGRVNENDICIRDPLVSRRHARITREGDVITIIDSKSFNATLVNKKAVSACRLKHGDEINIGDCSFVMMMKDDQVLLDTQRGEARVLPDAERSGTVKVQAHLSADDETLISPRGQELKGLLLEKLRRSLEALHELGEMLGSGIELDAFLLQLAEMLIKNFDAERVCILLTRIPNGELFPAATAFRDAADGHTMSLSKTIIDRAIEQKMSLLCQDAIRDESLGGAESVDALSIRSVMCTPLKLRRGLRGVIYLDNRSLPNEFDTDDLRLLQTMAGQVSVLIDNFKLLEELRSDVRHLREQIEESEPLIVGKSPSLEEVTKIAQKAAESNATILVLGESGTGKEVIAKSIHRWSDRRDRPFVVVNCAVLSDQLLESELFGHEKGAFTGALRQKKGKIEIADKGTVFLDEIGDVKPDMQVKLLRFLEEREFERVGGTQTIKVDVRIIAATNKDLVHEVQNARFRDDLYYRLRVIELRMPPLRERRADIPLLAERFLEDYTRETKKRITGFSKKAMELLRGHEWPGNIRELRNAVERAVVLCSGEKIEIDDLSLTPSATLPGLDASVTGYHDLIRELKKQVIQKALDRCGGIQSMAAEDLGLQPSYLSRLMKNLGMR
jgi:Nif-specific regulatory protein